MAVEGITNSVQAALDNLTKYGAENKTPLLWVGGTAAVLLLGSSLVYRPQLAGGKRAAYGSKSQPTTFQLSGGSIDRKEIKNEFNDYAASYSSEAGGGIREEDRNRTSQLVKTFYSLVTDIYEWGWGTSFHFSPLLPGKDWVASEAAHEARIPAILGLKPGQRCVDVGCGVGGPMRTIAACSGAHVTGITINDYQVARAKKHNEDMGVASLCDAVEGDFLEMPFQDGTFDGAYAIEATCHAAKLEEVYAEVFRVLKPGGMFVSYEWVSTKAFNPNNPEHVRIIDEINFGNGLPEMRTYAQAEAAGKTAGFELLESRDLATSSPVCGPWYGRLKFSRAQHHINQALVDVLSFLRIAPKGVKEVHSMLVKVAGSLVEGGETGVFSPLHMLVFRKPLSASASA